MTAREASKRMVESTWVRLVMVLALAAGGGLGGGSLMAKQQQPRTDQEIRELAKAEMEAETRVVAEKIKNIEGDIGEMKGDIKTIEGGIQELLRR